MGVIVTKWWFYPALLRVAKESKLLTQATNELLTVANRLLVFVKRKDEEVQEKVNDTLVKIEKKLPETGNSSWKPGDPDRRKGGG